MKGSKLSLNVEDYPGGIALWGSALAVYDTTGFDFVPGIHVHARKVVNQEKQIDSTFDKVNVLYKGQAVSFDKNAAISYLSASIANQNMTYLECPKCGNAHLDMNKYSVNIHKRHLCSICGCYFYSKDLCIGNPIIKSKEVFGDAQIHRKKVKPNRILDINQKDFPYGISIWGTANAFLWTAPRPEEDGIHVHAYKENNLEPTIDETFDSVVVDGISLNVEQVRIYMMQKTLPYLNNRIVALKCQICGNDFFDIGKDAFTPNNVHLCSKCNHVKRTRKKVVSNPIINTFLQLHSFTNLPMKINDIQTLYPALVDWE